MRSRIDKRKMFYGADSKAFETATMLRKNMTLAELILWKKLKDKDIFKTKFRRQHPVGIFIVDFYNHEYKLVIEIDGEIHQSDEAKIYDSGRAYKLENLGIKILRFTNDQVIFNLALVINLIHKEINKLTLHQLGEEVKKKEASHQFLFKLLKNC